MCAYALHRSLKQALSAFQNHSIHLQFSMIYEPHTFSPVANQIVLPQPLGKETMRVIHTQIKTTL